MPNIDRLKAVIDYIAEHPEEHRQHFWRAVTECGTTMCFAGHAAAMFGPAEGMVNWSEMVIFDSPTDGQMSASVVMADGEERDIEEFAAEILGLDYDQRERLFFNMGDVDDLRIIVEDIEAGLI